MEGIIAPSDYNPGDVIYIESPFVKVVRHEFKNVLCEFCLQKSRSLQACTACLAVKYCGKDCQKNDWSSHKLECKHLKNLPKGRSGDEARLIGQAILKIKGEDWKLIKREVLGTEFSFDDIDSHYKEMTENPRMIRFFNEIKELTGNYIGFENLPDDESLIKIVGKVRFRTKPTSGVVAFFLGASNFPLECIPNSNETRIGNIIKISACKKIRGGKDKITVPAQRILSLESQIEKSGTLSCKCTDCSLPYGESILFKIIDKERAFRVILETKKFLIDAAECPDIPMFSMYQQKADRLLREQEGVLGDTNCLRMGLLDLICSKIRADPKYIKGVLLKLEKSMRSVFGEYYIEMWPIYKSLYDANLELGDLVATKEYNEKANFIEQHAFQ